jgi:hypothetical protein
MISQSEMSDTEMFGLFYMEDLNTHTHKHTHIFYLDWEPFSDM